MIVSFLNVKVPSSMKIAVKFCGRCISIYLVRPARWSAGGTQPDNHNIDLIIILKLILPRLRTLLRGQKLLRSVCGHGRPGPASYSEGSISVAPGSGLGAANIEPSVGLVEWWAALLSGSVFVVKL